MLWKKRLLAGRKRSDSPRPIHVQEFTKSREKPLKEAQFKKKSLNFGEISKKRRGSIERIFDFLPKSSRKTTILEIPLDIPLDSPTRDVITCHFCGRCLLLPTNRVERNFGGVLLALRGIPLLGSFEWLLGWTTQLALFMAYAKAIELLVICYFYLDLASKMMHWSSLAGKRLCFSSLILLFTYFTLFLVMGFLLSIEPWTDCHAPYWIWFSCGEFLTVQLMVFSFLLIVNRMNRISASPNIHHRQRRQLFTLFWVFETSCLADLGYHVSLYLLADDEKGCSGIFEHDQLRYTLLKFPYDIVSFLLPVWTLLYFFRPQRKEGFDQQDSEESSLPPMSGIADVIVVRNWRRRYRPLVQDNSQYVPAPELRRVAVQIQRARREGSTGNNSVRRVSSAPQIADRQRRISISRSHISSTLYSIPEEIQQLQSSAPIDAAELVLATSIDNLSMAPQIEHLNRGNLS